MRKAVLTVGMLLAALLVLGAVAWTCGDKLLVVGRGVRFQGSPGQIASILLYAPAGSTASPAVRDPKFQSARRDAGHKLEVVENRGDVDQALKTGKYDIILAGVADAHALEAPAQSVPSNPVILPVVYNGTKAEAAAAQRRYGCVLKAPGRTGHYLGMIDMAMELKRKRSGSKP